MSGSGSSAASVSCAGRGRSADAGSPGTEPSADAAAATGPPADAEASGRGPSAETEASREPGRKPDWLKVTVPPARAFRATARVLDDLDLHTVCAEARCPNKGECFAAGTATFLILGDRCTRDCRFCSVRHGAPGGVVDEDEPERVARAAARLGLRHVVVTSVTRDDLPDGGAARFAAVIGAVRRALPAATVEVLTPDFRGDEAALRKVLAAGPDVFNHNLETVPRLYPEVRPAADYRRSLEVLERAGRWSSVPDADPARRAAEPAQGVESRGAHRPVVKTGLMLGLGETRDEVRDVLYDARSAGVGVVTMGQYLRPASGCVPVARYVPPAEFAEWTAVGESLGLLVVAGPFVRSSYRAGEALARMGRARGRNGGRAVVPDEEGGSSRPAEAGGRAR